MKYRAVRKAEDRVSGASRNVRAMLVAPGGLSGELRGLAAALDVAVFTDVPD